MTSITGKVREGLGSRRRRRTSKSRKLAGQIASEYRRREYRRRSNVIRSGEEGLHAERFGDLPTSQMDRSFGSLSEGDILVEPKQVDLKQQFRAMAQGSQSLAVAYIGVVNGLFAGLKRLGQADADALASAAGMDAAYVRRWCDAAYAFLYLEAEGDTFCLAESGAAMLPDAPGTLMPIAAQAMLNMHMAERAAALMRTGARPGEQVMGERETLLPWFGPMLEASFSEFFEQTICPNVPIFAEVDARGGMVVDLGCGNGWYLRALARRCGAVCGLGLDGFAENIAQATRLAAAAGFQRPASLRQRRRTCLQPRCPRRYHHHEPGASPCVGGGRRDVYPSPARKFASWRRGGHLGAGLARRPSGAPRSGAQRPRVPKPFRTCAGQPSAARRRNRRSLCRRRHEVRNLSFRGRAGSHHSRTPLRTAERRKLGARIRKTHGGGRRLRGYRALYVPPLLSTTTVWCISRRTHPRVR